MWKDSDEEEADSESSDSSSDSSDDEDDDDEDGDEEASERKVNLEPKRTVGSNENQRCAKSQFHAAERKTLEFLVLLMSN